MASLTNNAENDLALLIFNNTNWALIGDATGLRGSSSAGSFYISLHTSDPTEAAANQTAGETSYTNYARVAVARSGSGFTVSADTVTNAADISFPACGATGATITHVGIGTAASGTGDLIAYSTASLAVSSGITPIIAAGDLDIVFA